MNEAPAIVLQKVADYLRETMDHASVDEHARLDELGIDSMAMIAILVMLEQEFGLDVERMSAAKPPKTVGELVAIAVDALPSGVRQADAQAA